MIASCCASVSIHAGSEVLPPMMHVALRMVVPDEAVLQLLDKNEERYSGEAAASPSSAEVVLHNLKSCGQIFQ